MAGGLLMGVLYCTSTSLEHPWKPPSHRQRERERGRRVMHTDSFRLCHVHVRVADLSLPLQILFAANTDTDCLVTTIQVNTMTSQETHGHDLHATQITDFLQNTHKCMHACVAITL